MSHGIKGLVSKQDVNGRIKNILIGLIPRVGIQGFVHARGLL